jgi:16S rRNA G966 N2-methylase RsmD
MSKRNKSIDWKARLKYIFPGPEELQKKVKYDSVESISYVTPYSQAIIISKWITSLVYILHRKKKITMIECCGGLGGNTIQFSKNKNIDKVITFEIHSERYKSLIHNIKLYKRQSDSEIEAFNNNFFDWYIPGVKKYRDICIFVDPPWGKDYKEIKEIEKEIILIDSEDKKYTMIDLIDLFKEMEHVIAVVCKLPSTYNISVLANDYFTMRRGNTQYVFIDVDRMKRLSKNKK